MGFTKEIPEFIPDPREVERMIYCGFETLVDKRIRKETRIEVSEKYSIMAPYFAIEDEIVWGATAMMLSELMVIWENS